MKSIKKSMISVVKPSKTLLSSWMKVFFMFSSSILVLLIGGFFVFIMASDGSEEYKQKIDACVKARMPDGAGAKSITDYVCPEGLVESEHDVAYQVVLDLAFQKIDKDLKKALQDYQGTETRKSTDVNNQLVTWFDETAPGAENSFTTKYRDICHNLESDDNPVGAVVKSYSGSDISGQTPEFLYGPNSCSALVDTKIAAYRQIGYLI